MTPFKKKVLAFALAGTFALSQAGFVSAAVDATETTNINKYDTVRNDMKLIQGDGQQVTLHKPMERYRAFVLYARMLGLASDLQDYIDAFDATDKTVENFSDAAGQSPYVTAAMAYFKENALSGGDNKGNFNPHANITGQEFYKMMLEALGYVQDTDFTYAEVADKALELGLITNKDMAGSNKLEEVEIGAALYDTLNSNVKPAADAPADAKTVTLAYKLALANDEAIPYLAAFDKTAPTLTVTEPHAIGSRNPGVADGTTATDVTASATVDMAEGMPLIGTLSEAGTVHYNFNGQEGTIKTDTVANDKGTFTFDTTKLETAPEGSVKGYFPFINTGDNKNVVTMWAEDLAGNKTKELNWKSLIRSTEFVTGGNYTTSGSTLMVTGSSVDLYFTTDMNSVPKVSILKAKTDKTGTEVTNCKEVTAADVAAAKLVTPLTIGADADIHIYKATINFTDINTFVRIDATSGKDFGSIVSGNGKALTFQSTAKANLNPTFVGSSGGFIVTFPTEIDVDSANKDNFLRDAVKASSVVVLDDNKTVYAMFDNVQSTEYATVSVTGVKSKDGTATMAQAVSAKITIIDTTNPSVVSSKILSPNVARFYFSKPVIGKEVDKIANYTLNGNPLYGTATGKGAYVDIVSNVRFTTGNNVIGFNFRDNGVFPFINSGTGNATYAFTYADDKTAPVPELVKLTNNYISIKFPNDKINPSTVSASNASWSYTQSRTGAVATAAVVSTNAQGYDVVTYYFANSAMQVGSNVDFVLSGIKDMWNNQMPLAVLSGVAIADSSIATPTFTIDGQGTGDIKDPTTNANGIGDVTFKVAFDRPVSSIVGTTNNFVLKDKNGNTVSTFGLFTATGDGTVRQPNSAVYGYKEYKFVLPGSKVVPGDYTLTISNLVDVVSGQTIPTATLPVVTVKDNAQPRVTSVYTDGTDLFLTFNMAMDETSVKNINNYYESNASGTAISYLTLRTDKSISLLADKMTVQIPLNVATTSTKAMPAYVAVLGVKSTQNTLIAVTAPNYVSNSANVSGITTNVLSDASVTIVGVNKIKVTFADGIQANNVQYNDFGLYYHSPVANDDINLLSRYSPEYTASVEYSPTDLQGHTVIVYDFTRYMANTKNLFTPDARMLDINGNYMAPTANLLYAKANTDPAQIVTRDRFGRAIVAGGRSVAATVNKISPTLAPALGGGLYPIMSTTSAASTIDAANLAGITTPQSVVFLGFNKSMDPTLANITAFANGMRIYNESTNTYLNQGTDFTVGKVLFNDADVIRQINGRSPSNQYTAYANNDGPNSINNVVAIYVNTLSGIYTPGNVLSISMPVGLTDVDGNGTGSLGNVRAFTLQY